jgi:hypothetical protein
LLRKQELLLVGLMIEEKKYVDQEEEEKIQAVGIQV